MAIAVTLTGPLVLFNPWFVGAEQDRHHVPARLGVDDASVDRITGRLLRDLFLGGDFDVRFDTGGPVLDPSERSHMADVGGLVRVLAIVDVVALVTAAVAWRALRHEPARRQRLLLASAIAIAVGALLIGLFAALAFDTFFLAFHRLFFREGTFLFGPDSNLLRLFPGEFWFEASLAAGAAVAVPAIALALIGRYTRGG